MPSAVIPLPPSLHRPAPPGVRLWLYGLCAALLVMVALGGATRLTNSGLSMVEWKPLTVLPPLTEADWQSDFSKYQQSPEYRHRTTGMTLSEYKGIFWLEYVHRLWGRMIGACVLVPLAVFSLRRRLAPPLLRRMGLLFVLGGAQGGLGWLMVASGLNDRPEVSHFRLGAHFLMAVLLYGLLLTTALRLTAGPDGRATLMPPRPGDPVANALLVPVTLTLLWGAFTAGLDAGLFYNTFPLMDGQLLPPDLAQAPLWPPGPGALLLVENPATVQFVHRCLAVLTVLGLCLSWLLLWRHHPAPAVRRAAQVTALAAVAQMALGIATLLAAVPVPLGVAHQTGALLLVTCLLVLRHLSGACRTTDEEGAR